MRRWITICVVVLLLVIPADASDIPRDFYREFEVDQLEEGIPREAKELMGDISVEDSPEFLHGILELAEHVIHRSDSLFSGIRKLMVRIILIVILCKLNDSIGEHNAVYVGRIAGALAMMTFCISDLSTMVGAGKKTIEQMSSFTHLLLPVMTSVTCAAGFVSGSVGIYAVTVFFSDLLLRFCSGVLLPGIYTCTGLAMADCLLGQERLKRVWNFLKWMMELGLKGVTYGFSVVISVTGILAGSADAAALKGVKSAISVMVPVVGGIISGAADTVLSGASLLKHAVGVFGMLAVIAICLLPFLKLGLSWIVFRGVSAVSAILGSNLTGLLDAISSMMGILLGMVGSCAWIVMLACCCYVKVVHI